MGNDRQHKKEWAQILYCKEGLSQKEIADKVGVTEKTIRNWRDEGKWETIKVSVIMSRENELNRIYAQINELNTHIENKPQGQRFANSKEADALKKLTSAAKDLETERSLRNTIDVFIEFTKWLSKTDVKKSQEAGQLFDAYINTLNQ